VVRVRTDDEVYRVDAVWLGPPKATFPWRARYVAWGVGILVFLLTLTVERQIGFGFGFFTVAWALVITIVLTRFIGSKISHERPLTAVMTMWSRELHSPRERPSGQGGATSAAKIRIHDQRPRPRPKGVKRVKTAPVRNAPAPRKPARQPRKGQPARRQGQPNRQAGQQRQAAQHRGQPAQYYGQNVPYAQNYAGRSGENRAVPPKTGHRAARRRSKEVGGVRTPGSRK
jgi:hypothetical protein